MSEALDTVSIEAWLTANLSGFEGPMTVSKIIGGQSNPTYRLVTPRRAYVLRRKPPGVLLRSAHAVDREFRVQRALARSEVPVPEMHVLCEDDQVIGSAFYIMEAVEGRQFDDPRLPDLDAGERAAVYSEMNRILAAIHSVNPEAVGLGDYGPKGNYYARQVGRWTKQYLAAETESIAAMDELIGWLEVNLPEDDGKRTLVHGDYRIDNLLFASGGTNCVAVLDWELSTLGHPFADLAALVMQWRMPPGDEGRGLAGVDRVGLGLPSDEAFVADYCRRMGLPGIARFEFYLAFCFFRMAAILQGVKRRALDGNAADPERGLVLGKMVPLFAREGLTAIAEAPGHSS